MVPGPTARGVLSRVVATVRLHWRELLLISLVVFVPVGLLDTLDQAFSELDQDELDSAGALGVLAVGVTLALTELFGEIMLAGVIAGAIGDVHSTRERRPLGELLRAIPYMRLVAITLLSVAAFALGLVLFIVPAIIFLARYVLASPVAEVEDLGVREAFARSHELSHGHVRLVLGVLIPLTLLTSALGQGAQDGGVGLLGDGIPGEWLGAVVSGVLIATPWALAAVALVYELKAAEGGDAPQGRSRSSPQPPR